MGSNLQYNVHRCMQSYMYTFFVGLIFMNNNIIPMKATKIGPPKNSPVYGHTCMINSTILSFLLLNRLSHTMLLSKLTCHNVIIMLIYLSLIGDLHNDCISLMCYLCILKCCTIGRVLIAQFNNYILVKSGQIANPIIAMDEPVPYCSIRAGLCLRINYLRNVK